MPTLTRSLAPGARGSALARWQTDWVLTRLLEAWPDLDCQTPKVFTTSGDRILDQPLPEIGGKGLFTEELENALRSGEIDLAVHSLKDLPIAASPGLTLGAICARADARDVLISRSGLTFDSLPRGAHVGTSSLRRSAQLLAARPDLTLLPLRGNVDTRVRKALNAEKEGASQCAEKSASQCAYDAIVLAAAGVLRLGLGEHITQYLPFDLMLPAPGQGALAVQCRADDLASLDLLAAIDDAAARAAVTAERAFLQALGGGCSAPVAAYAQSARHNPQPTISLMGLVAARDGRRAIRVSGQGRDPAALGEQLAQQALAQGAGGLL